MYPMAFAFALMSVLASSSSALIVQPWMSNTTPQLAFVHCAGTESLYEMPSQATDCSPACTVGQHADCAVPALKASMATHTTMVQNSIVR
eukprot:CAMPEP_0174358816 /NCGR_PEP_ID=MMETSP0811_2-20130205/44818_1 /TAXON_ID=73025 ORGANISM="Eutreptiella gymnastica-like, Strain CCMP1594" /NCGR_SAMPLE_ID=MMETSP0811_2 /ASSEMBLY_ACC=CAM_ASM_000667 /LENGTH=89 /DNA_ID=CAMNT_0015492915 /DNA_START=12 /DNA_END=277 /DNA_ORIENTATION=-